MIKIKGHDIKDIGKYLKVNMKFKIPKNSNNSARIYMFSLPTYANIGDQAIAIAQKRFLNQYFPSYRVIDIPDYATISAIAQLKNKIQDEDLVFIQGGGNFGNLYPRAEKDRRYIFKAFKKNKIISFPQSIYFTADDAGKKSYEQIKRIIQKHEGDCIISARDPESLNKLINMNLGIHLEKIPDIVLSLPVRVRQHEKRAHPKVLFLFRTDKEKSISEDTINVLKEQLQSNHIEYTVSDTTINELHVVSWQDRVDVVRDKIDEIAGYDLVITDRLHGMILSYIADTPCIALSNNNGKVKNLYEDFLKKSNYIFFLENMDTSKVLDIIDSLPDEHKHVDFSADFDRFAKCIKSMK